MKQFIITQKSVLKNALNLNDKGTFMINEFVNKNIYSEDVERDTYYTSEEWKPSSNESIAERVKPRRQKNLMINNHTLQIWLI